MQRDPFYGQILEALNKPLDSDAFERCAADLLRSDFPGLVPVLGGSDAGMDGAVGDAQGYPFPLISTTSKDVIDNLTKNLRSYTRHKGKRHECILATSQALTPKRRRNLQKRADDLGFVLLQIYDREAFADRLVYNPRWCLELLNLTGGISPLSAVPLSTRPFINQEAVGRHEDLGWLTSTEGDRVLVGQPGSGKTFLLRMLTKNLHALFVTRKDTSEIAQSFRSLRPVVIMVDDAHLDSGFLTQLVHMRGEIGASFDIIASCWTGTENTIASALGVPEQKVRNLALLSRDQMVEVIKQVGIKGPVDLIREIVNQAEGKPGLAVTLSYLCINGDVTKVALGDALCASILNSFEPITGKKVGHVLAAFAVGGTAGMPEKAVAEFLGLPRADIIEIVTYLAWGGIISHNSLTKNLSVYPDTLRFALVRDTFFRGPAPMDVEELIEQAPDIKETALTLIGAKARGASVPSERLYAIVGLAGSIDVWNAYAWLGKGEAVRVLTSHSENIVEIAHPVLHNAPEVSIPILLRAAVGDLRPLHSSTDHPLRIIDDWVTSGRPGSSQVKERRRFLLEAIRKALSEGVDESVCLRALPSALSLEYQTHFSDPGSGNKLTIVGGSVTLDELKYIGDSWPKVLSVIAGLRTSDPRLIIEVVGKIAFPSPARGSVEKGFYETKKKILSGMLTDLAKLPNTRLGLLHRLASIAHRLEIQFNARIDKDFLTVFPFKESSSWKEDQERWLKQVRSMARRLSKKKPSEVLERIVLLDAEARAAGITWPRLTPVLCVMIAENITSYLITWTKVLIEFGASGDLIEPFLKKAVRNDETNWKDLVETCLGNNNLRYVAAGIVLTMESPPKSLLDNVLHNLDGLAGMIETLCIRSLVPEKTLALLLMNPDHVVSGKVALGEWQAEPLGQVRAGLLPVWQQAILNLDNDDYWLGEILKKDLELCYEWLKKHLPDKQIRHETRRIVKMVVKLLDEKQRQELIQLVPEDAWNPEIIDWLVADSLAVYQQLIRDPKKINYHLAPLCGFKGEAIGEESWEEIAWIDKALLALQMGYTPEKIVEATFGYSWSWEGNESDMWHRWLKRFESLSAHDNPDLSRVGKEGERIALARMKRALETEQQEAIYGRR